MQREPRLIPDLNFDWQSPSISFLTQQQCWEARGENVLVGPLKLVGIALSLRKNPQISRQFRWRKALKEARMPASSGSFGIFGTSSIVSFPSHSAWQSCGVPMSSEPGQANFLWEAWVLRLFRRILFIRPRLPESCSCLQVLILALKMLRVAEVFSVSTLFRLLGSRALPPPRKISLPSQCSTHISVRLLLPPPEIVSASLLPPRCRSWTHGLPGPKVHFQCLDLRCHNRSCMQ